MTTKNISRNKGCRLLVIEPVHCGPSSIRLLTFFGTPCTCICFVRRGGSSMCSIWVYLFTFVIAAAVRQFSADAAAATTAVSRPPPRFCNKLCFFYICPNVDDQNSPQSIVFTVEFCSQRRVLVLIISHCNWICRSKVSVFAFVSSLSIVVV